MNMDRERFEQLVAKAVDSLPDEFHTRMENIDVVLKGENANLVKEGIKVIMPGESASVNMEIDRLPSSGLTVEVNEKFSFIPCQTQI